MIFDSREPVLDSSTGQHTLDYNGRATVPSVKNFQLENKTQRNGITNGGKNGDPYTACMCGKVDDYTFNLDYKPPFNAYQAFAVALSQFDT